jgi:hypothetical protein
MGAGPQKKGAVTPLLRKKGVPAKIIIPKCTDRVIGSVKTKKYQPNTNRKNQIGTTTQIKTHIVAKTVVGLLLGEVVGDCQKSGKL